MRKRIIALLLALILTVGLLPTVALAADGENPTTDSGSVTKEASKDNLNLVKTVTKEGDNYKITLESWQLARSRAVPRRFQWILFCSWTSLVL